MGNRKALRAGIWYTIGNFLLKAVSFITTPIFTRILSVEDVGNFSNFTSWLSILMIITTVDLYHAINVARFDYREDLDNFIASNLLQGSLITTISFSIIYCFKRYFLNLFSMGGVELFMIFLYCLFCPSVQMYQLKCRIDYKYKASVAVSIISAISSTVISLLLVISLQNKYLGRYIGYSVPIIVINFAIYVYLLKKSNSINPRKYWRYAMAIAFPMMWHTLAGNILSTSDRVMIKYFIGSSEVALYTIAYSCASIVQLLWMSMNSAWSPWAIEKMGEDDYESINNAMIPYSLFFAFVVFAFLLIAPEALLLMGGKSYMPAIKVIPPIMVSYIFNFSYSYYANIELYHKKQVYIATSTMLAAFINVLLNLLLIPHYGYVIAAYTTLIGYVSLLLMHFFACTLIKKASKVNNKFIFLYLGGSTGIMFFAMLLYQHSIVRYCIIALLMILSISAALLFRKELLYLLKYSSSYELKKKIHILTARIH